MAVLTIRNLSLGYDSHAIVENLNFSVNAGSDLFTAGKKKDLRRKIWTAWE